MGKIKVKSTIILVLAFALAIFGVACANPLNKDTDKKEVKPLLLSYVSKAYLDGENVKNVLIEYSQDRQALPKELAQSSSDEQASFLAVGALNLLKEVPDSISQEATTSISRDLVINNVTIKYGTAVVDLSADSLESIGGSTEESLLISQIVNTLLNSFDEVKSVQFMVDGKEIDSLMGHVDTSEPFVAPTIR